MNRCVFSMICVSAGSKSTLAKAAGAEAPAPSKQEKLHAALPRSTFSSQNVKKLTVPATFGSSDVQKFHAAVARSTFASQNATKFWKCRCPKIPRRCSEKHICKSKCYKILEVQMSKNCTPLQREAHLQVKMLRN